MTKRIREGRQPKLITFNGKTMSRKDWAAHLGLNKSSLRKRLCDWSLEDALTIPPQDKPVHKPGPRLAWLEQAGGGSNTFGNS